MRFTFFTFPRLDCTSRCHGTGVGKRIGPIGRIRPISLITLPFFCFQRRLTPLGPPPRSGGSCTRHGEACTSSGDSSTGFGGTCTRVVDTSTDHVQESTGSVDACTDFGDTPPSNGEPPQNMCSSPQSMCRWHTALFAGLLGQVRFPVNISPTGKDKCAARWSWIGG